ncbi:hypothetical protein [Gimesia panareensis]|uniref:Uncharacterized protein n=1 Tax=Gimesia panareensis TaxID=2527978 RepID=A0A517Q7E8_9PLAN|nr:hypothetical protein [Gimesia panareensis]QDT27557.1 hypothetical protein Enr10x_28750 [Gimesia panareensis]QDU49618.1 hypothetical protein Pan110_19560 [Gimesia panareensis]
MNILRSMRGCSGNDGCCASHRDSSWVLKMIVSGVFVFLFAGLTQAKPFKTSYEQQAIKVSISMSTTSVRVAEPFTVTYELTAPSDQKLVWPAVADQLGPFDVIESNDFFDIPVDSGRMWKRVLTLESIQSGNLEIPPLAVNMVSSESSQVQSEPLKAVNIAAQPVTVSSVLEGRADPTQFRDIQSVVDVKVPVENTSPWTTWGVTGLGVISLACVAFVVMAVRGRSITPEKWVLQQLDALSAKVTENSADNHHQLTELTDITKHYLALQYDIPASQQTTHELLQLLADRNIGSTQVRDELNSVLSLADEVKFAGLDLSVDELQTAIQTVRQSVPELSKPLVPATTIPEVA